jgi:putative oxidoreductase
MNAVALPARANALAASVAALLQSPFLLVLRVYVSWQFLKSGWLKIGDWDNTLFLFQEEYRVPLLPPAIAAALGTAGELVFPALLVAGLLTRYAALGLFAVNVLAVVSYAHVLLSDGFEAAYGQHVLWGLMMLVIALFGPGRFALDALLAPAGPGPHRR